MDKIDRKIINSLQKNARASLKDLSKECFISSPAIAARINKLEKSGIINGYHSSIDIEKIGFHVRAFIQVQLEPRQKDEFYPYVQSIPNVVECNCVTGDYSEIMEVIFPSTTDLDNFINTIQQRFGKTSTQIVFSTSVQHRGITLDDEA
ncbi:MAG: Lrp/AsnC family transcriptional regulator [Limosilactobacillus oris]|jgi:Lrp/AsnC family leucine-responsive transcriptional regulator|uniref:Lrp/AsnC family transcriptional regulator n=1 Tax=Limosilactobacillus oris TaxID=1632 RepID=UPI000789DBD7|nr:Lrp/AsnC family transcriptional regulator [Limosilactobacillus oris]AMS07829.1 AsnC family transcriptional regulator [Limosilactobacillus oris]MCH3910807.1 Lrp/AsnC family transcriptional regulator [Limosilactobacillus oris]MCH3938059.1 Lrp/AsnC family transcriptional regulator [Limosilactobacillus oris]MCI1981315.1 Lrp/AsnC family transcriptional regulator [Limosilactobacillus oris]MCI2043306.1 Lrp/AsnC family transcriptional regulator [Limosilactobacillus oris]